jgi:hypothetical protein
MGVWVKVSLSVGDGGANGLRSLHGWLSQQPGLRGQVGITPRPPRAGEMGSVPDLVTVLVGSGGAISVLIGSLRTWLAQPRRSDIRVKMHLPDGKTVDVDARRVGDAEALLRAVLDSGQHPVP